MKLFDAGKMRNKEAQIINHKITNDQIIDRLFIEHQRTKQAGRLARNLLWFYLLHFLLLPEKNIFAIWEIKLGDLYIPDNVALEY